MAFIRPSDSMKNCQKILRNKFSEIFQEVTLLGKKYLCGKLYDSLVSRIDIECFLQ